MKIKQEVIKELSLNELNDKLAIERANSEKMIINHAISPLENPLQIKTARRNVARIVTEINKRQQNG